MGTQVNRAILLWENWQDKQRMLEEVFGKGAAGELARQQYDFFSQGIDRISPGATPDERLVLALIGKTTAKLERQLYPGRIMRSFYRVKAFLYDRPRQAAKLSKLKAENVESLGRRLSGLGLNSKALDLDKLLDFERQHIRVDLVAPYGTGHNFSVQLQLEKDGNGQYQLNEYTAILKDPMNPEQSRSFTFDPAMGIHAREAANLLQGRAVLKYDQVGLDRTASKWIQLDFQVLTSEGKPRLRETGADYEYNIGKELINIAGVLQKPELTSTRVLQGMEQGNQIILKQASGHTAYLEADPLGKRIQIRNDQQQPITLDKLQKQRESALKLQPVKQRTVALKKQPDNKKVKDQSIGIA